MIALALIWVISCAWASPNNDSFLTVYGFHPKYPELGNFHNGVSLKRQITLRDVYERPVIILSAAGTQAPGKFSAYYAKNGLGSVQANGSFKPLYSYLRRQSNILGLVFPTDGVPFMPTFLRYDVDNLVFPDKFTVEDLIEFAEEDLLILYVASEEDFKQCGFPPIAKLGTFSINDQSVVPLSHAQHYPLRILPFFFVSPYIYHQHHFQKPVFQIQYPHKPYFVASWKPHQKVDNKIGNSVTAEPPKNISSSDNNSTLANSTTPSPTTDPVNSSPNPTSPSTDPSNSRPNPSSPSTDPANSRPNPSSPTIDPSNNSPSSNSSNYRESRNT